MTNRVTLAVVLLCALSTAGCTVPVGGVTGLSVDDAGQPVAVVSMCEGFIDGLVLYLAAGEGAVDVADGRAPWTWTASLRCRWLTRATHGMR